MAWWWTPMWPGPFPRRTRLKGPGPRHLAKPRGRPLSAQLWAGRGRSTGSHSSSRVGCRHAPGGGSLTGKVRSRGRTSLLVWPWPGADSQPAWWGCSSGEGRPQASPVSDPPVRKWTPSLRRKKLRFPAQPPFTPTRRFQNPTLPLAEPQKESGDSRQLCITSVNRAQTEGLGAGEGGAAGGCLPPGLPQVAMTAHLRHSLCTGPRGS